MISTEYLQHNLWDLLTFFVFPVIELPNEGDFKHIYFTTFYQHHHSGDASPVYSYFHEWLAVSPCWTGDGPISDGTEYF